MKIDIHKQFSDAMKNTTGTTMKPLHRMSDADLGDVLADCAASAGCPPDIRQRLGRVLAELAQRQQPHKFKRGDRVRVRDTNGPVLVVVEQLDDLCRLTRVDARGQQQDVFLPVAALEFASSHVDSAI